MFPPWAVCNMPSVKSKHTATRAASGGHVSADRNVEDSQTVAGFHPIKGLVAINVRLAPNDTVASCRIHE